MSPRSPRGVIIMAIDTDLLTKALQAAGLLPASGDLTRAEPNQPAAGGTVGVVDNTLEGTKRLLTTVRNLGVSGAGVAGVGTVGLVGLDGWDWNQNGTVIAVGVAGIAIVLVAWIVCVAWATRADQATRLQVATRMLSERGNFATAVATAMLTPGFPPTGANGWHDAALRLALSDENADVFVRGGAHGPVKWTVSGDPPKFRLATEKPPVVHDLGDIEKVELRN